MSMTRKVKPCLRCGQDVVLIDSDKEAVWCVDCIKMGIKPELWK